MHKTVLITGATSGIGEACARLLASHGFKIIICGRRRDRLQALQETLSAQAEVEVLCFDVRDRNAVERAIGSLPEQWNEIDVLINNAGNAHGLAPIHQGDVNDWDAMIDINVKGLLYVSNMVIPGMTDRKKGHVINIGSIAGQEVYPQGNVYCASKYAVEAISQGMRVDLNPFGIKVTAINPGLVETEFSLVRFKGAKDRAADVYKDMEPLTAADVADVVYFAISRPSHVNVSDITLLPTAQATATTVHRG